MTTELGECNIIKNKILYKMYYSKLIEFPHASRIYIILELQPNEEDECNELIPQVNDTD
jgi:hypothetical protein